MSPPKAAQQGKAVCEIQEDYKSLQHCMGILQLAVFTEKWL